MAEYRVVIETRGGSTVTGEAKELTEKEVEQVKSLIGDLMFGSKGQLNVEVDGDTVWVPLHAIDHVGLMKWS